MKNFKLSIKNILSVKAVLLLLFSLVTTVVAAKPLISPTDPIEKEKAYQAEPASKRVIHIGYDGGLCQAAIPIAQLKGFFEAEGIKTELTKAGGGFANARDAIVGGKVDTYGGMVAEWLKPITNGVDVRFTFGLHTGCTSAFVLADSKITKFEKGQKVAVTGGIGGAQHNISFRFISHDGLQTTDFSWLDLPADQALTVLKNGDADVFVLGDQLAEKWVQDGSLRRIRSLHGDADFGDESCCVLAISGPFIDANPVTAEKISRAIYNAARWIGESDENKREAAKLLLENGFISGTEEYAFSLAKLFKWGLSTELTEKTLDNSIAEYQSLGVIDKNLKPADIKAQVWFPIQTDKK
jgi:NitT/TauT family transport system substrate-binding protein